MKYRRPSKMRRMAKWAGFSLCFGIGLLWVVSEFYVIVYSQQGWYICFSDGLFSLVQHENVTPYGWHAGRLVEPYPGFFKTIPWRITRGSVGKVVQLSIPLWYFLIIAALPSMLLWRRDRRPPPGHCRACGYNTTGNESGICPECGKAINSVSTATESEK